MPPARKIARQNLLVTRVYDFGLTSVGDRPYLVTDNVLGEAMTTWKVIGSVAALAALVVVLAVVAGLAVPG
jgi:hypothetical protein